MTNKMKPYHLRKDKIRWNVNVKCTPEEKEQFISMAEDEKLTPTEIIKKLMKGYLNNKYIV